MIGLSGWGQNATTSGVSAALLIVLPATGHRFYGASRSEEVILGPRCLGVAYSSWTVRRCCDAMPARSKTSNPNRFRANACFVWTQRPELKSGNTAIPALTV